VTFPKIEPHVHLEGTVRTAALLDIAKRNDVALPADTVEALAGLCEFTDFAHFAQVRAITTCARRTARDFRQTVVGYAAEAANHGAGHTGQEDQLLPAGVRGSCVRGSEVCRC
jgi:aminodeoxyfutalosine deaminase